MTSVVVADDHPLFLAGVTRAIEDAPELELLAAAQDGTSALACIREHRPQVALLDVRLPGMAGTEVLASLVADEHPTRVVFLSAQAEAADVRRALTAGAAGYLSKDADDQEIVGAVVAAAAGRLAVSDELQRKVLADLRAGADASDSVPSPRERDVLRLAAEGKTAEQIGLELFLSTSTVKTYLTRAYEKLGVNDRAAAVAAAVRRGWID